MPARKTDRRRRIIRVTPNPSKQHTWLESHPRISSIVPLLVHIIIALVPFNQEKREKLFFFKRGIKLKPHADRILYTVWILTGPRRHWPPIVPDYRKTKPLPDRLELSVGRRAENLPQSGVMKCPIAELSPRIRGLWSTYGQLRNTSKAYLHAVCVCVCVTMSVHVKGGFSYYYTSVSSNLDVIY